MNKNYMKKTFITFSIITLFVLGSSAASASDLTSAQIRLKVLQNINKLKQERANRGYSQISVKSVSNSTYKVATLWGKVQEKLATTSTDEIKKVVKEVAKQNDIAIPEWGINGRLDSRALKASVLDSLFR